MSDEDFANYTQPEVSWFCDNCKQSQFLEPQSPETLNARESEPSDATQVLGNIQQAINTAEASTSSELPPQDNGDDFDVERIVGHKVVGGKRQFNVKLTNFRRPYWFEERNLRGCHGILSIYLTEKGLEPPKFPARVGAVCLRPGMSFNSDNYAAMEEIIQQAAVWSSSKRFKDALPVIIYNGQFPSHDAVVLINIESHCFVLLFTPSRGQIFAADGVNEIARNSSYREKIESASKMPVIPLHFMQQVGVDHCASSAAALVIEFKRLYQNPELINQSVRVEPFALSRIRGKLHKAISEHPNPGWVPINEIPFPTCAKCGKLFREASRQRYVAHVRKCSA